MRDGAGNWRRRPHICNGQGHAGLQMHSFTTLFPRVHPLLLSRVLYPSLLLPYCGADTQVHKLLYHGKNIRCLKEYTVHILYKEVLCLLFLRSIQKKEQRYEPLSEADIFSSFPLLFYEQLYESKIRLRNSKPISWF